MQRALWLTEARGPGAGGHTLELKWRFKVEQVVPQLGV